MAASGHAAIWATENTREALFDAMRRKGSLCDDRGVLHERAYDVAVSNGRTIGSDGRARATVGSSVDVANATYANSIGAAQLSAVWTDPDFDPSVPAFYYARVIEIPKPRWTARDAHYFAVAMNEDVPMVTQDRAYTSPIWYVP
jgi:hypothetical protein